MYLKSRLLYLYVETPLHAGAGSGLGPVDLPIQRERATTYPIVQASGLKGALREMAESQVAKLPDQGPSEKALRADAYLRFYAAFGPDTEHADEHAGAAAPNDARILLFPVRSLKGVYAWTTCLDVLQRWRREAETAGIGSPPALPATSPATASDGTVECLVSGGGAVTDDGFVVLEEFAYKRQADTGDTVKALAQWLAENALPYPRDSYWARQLTDKLVILPDDHFRDFALHATEVLTRVRLEPDSKTVASGALWTEEHLPPDTLLYAPVRATRLRTPVEKTPAAWANDKLSPEAQANEVLKWVSDKVQKRLQLGGDETVGRGIVSLRWTGGSQ
jgi:CRISPR-associated protein Cmr4